MDDFTVSSLNDSRNEWCSYLINIFTPSVFEGIDSIFREAYNLCINNNESNKYLMTFQQFLRRVPKWNNQIINSERERIERKSGCDYLEDLIMCVHIIQLKTLTCIRVGQKQKKIDLNIPSVNDFIHNIYMKVARELYLNAYLFEMDASPLLKQKNRRETELIIKDCILRTIRESVPIKSILQKFMDEGVEEEVDVQEEIIEKPAPEPEPESQPTPTPVSETEPEPEPTQVPMEQQTKTVSLQQPESPIQRLTFSDIDKAMNVNGNEESIEAPKDIERLERLAQEAHEKRLLEEDDEDSDDEPIQIGDEITLDFDDVNEIPQENKVMNLQPVELDIESL